MALNLMRVAKTLFRLLMVGALQIAPVWGKVLVRWTQPVVPPAAALGVNELVLAWNAGFDQLLQTARRQGYKVYVETAVENVAAVINASRKNLIAGIILNFDDSERSHRQGLLQALRSKYPGMAFLILGTNGKQPQMKGQMVFERNGILMVSSPTSQPWVDSNFALAQFERMRSASQIPLYSFQWDLSDQLQRAHGPSMDDYCLAIAEASALHADLILNLHESVERALAQNDSKAWTAWRQVRTFLDFSTKGPQFQLEPLADVGIVTDADKNSLEAVNLLVRHNIPLRVMGPSELNEGTFRGLHMVIVFSAPGIQEAKALASFANNGRIVVLVDVPGSYPWHSLQHAAISEHAATYIAGKGRIIELSEPVTDPEVFAQDIRGLLGNENLTVSLWNSLTTLVVAYRSPGSDQMIMEFVDYAEEPVQVQIRVKGNFAAVQYESPEQGCCASLAVVKKGEFTEFVIPSLQTAGRTYLKPAADRHAPAR